MQFSRTCFRTWLVSYYYYYRFSASHKTRRKCSLTILDVVNIFVFWGLDAQNIFICTEVRCSNWGVVGPVAGSLGHGPMGASWCLVAYGAQGVLWPQWPGWRDGCQGAQREGWPIVHKNKLPYKIPHMTWKGRPAGGGGPMCSGYNIREIYMQIKHIITYTSKRQYDTNDVFGKSVFGVMVSTCCFSIETLSYNKQGYLHKTCTKHILHKHRKLQHSVSLCI